MMNTLNIAFVVLMSTTRGHAVSFPSEFLIENPSTQADQAVGISLLYCKWNGQRLDGCPDNNNVGYGGVANFDVASAAVSTTDLMELILPFITPYDSVPPVCNLQLEGQEFAGSVMLIRSKVEQNQVKVYMFYASGTAIPWVFITTKLSVICYGPTILQTF